jgi:uncharacterized protein with ParB-like and HNH nuclease domain
MDRNEKPGINFEFVGIGSVIYNIKMCVPLYQRSYSWEEKQIDDLFLDIISAVEVHEQVYFIGTIVTTNKNNYMEIIDGQQRLATITILLSLIRDYFYNKSDDQRASQIESSYLMKQDLRSLEILPNMKLNENDNKYFTDAILRKPDDPERTNLSLKYLSNERIKFAQDYLKKKLDNYILSKNNNDECLFKIIEFIHNSLKVINVTVLDDVNAFTIFETLNDRGLSLAISDLIKNYLFGLSGDRLFEAQSNWISMYNLFDSNEDKSLIVKFLRHHWSSTKKIVREKDLYPEIKKTIRTKNDAVTYCTDLNTQAQKYLSLLYSDHSLWNSYNTKAKKTISILNKLGITQARPLLLAIVQNFSKQETEKSIELILSGSIRLLIHGGSSSGAIEENYCKSAQKINKKEITTKSELKNELKSIIPNNTIFMTSFEIAKVSKAFLARYYLLSIENYIRNKISDETIISDDEDSVNLEHILPQSKSKNWPQFSDEQHKAYYNRLGNLTILSTKKNSDLKDSSFKEKIKTFKLSEIIITKKLSDKENWGISDIEDRQKDLAIHAIKVWPF